MVDQCCSVYQERSVTDLEYVFAVWWRIVLGCFVKCMSGNGWGGTSLPPPSLFPLIFPSAVSPPPPRHCQHACAAQMILYHCSNKASKENGTSLNPLWDAKWPVSLYVSGGFTLSEISASQKSVAWDIIVKLWRTFCLCIWTALPHACVFLCNGLRLWSGHLL